MRKVKSVSCSCGRCKKGEVFNEYIGKYIAVKRLLGEPIEEMFFNISQPTEVEIGSLVRRADKGISVYAPHGLSIKTQLYQTVHITGRSYRIMEGETYTILDDTGYVDENDWNAVAPSSPAVLDCYDRQLDDCDMSCQGMTECIRAKWIKGLQERPSKKEMKDYIKEIKKGSKILEKSSERNGSRWHT